LLLGFVNQKAADPIYNICKRKKRKKESITIGGVAKKTRRNGINDGFVRWVSVYAVVPCFSKSIGLCQPTNLLNFFSCGFHSGNSN